MARAPRKHIRARPRKKAPQDLTLRNLRAVKVLVQALAARVGALETLVGAWGHVAAVTTDPGSVDA